MLSEGMPPAEFAGAAPGRGTVAGGGGRGRGAGAGGGGRGLVVEVAELLLVVGVPEPLLRHS